MAAARVGTELALDVQRRLAACATRATREWFENYVKGTRWRGVKVPPTRAAILAALAARDQRPSLRARYDAGLALLRSKYCDDKLGGMIVIAEHVLPTLRLPAAEQSADDAPAAAAIRARLLDDVENLLKDESASGVADWSTCDWLCVRVVGPFAAAFPDQARRVLGWSHRPPDQSSVWARRAGHVSFVNLVSKMGKVGKPPLPARARGDGGGQGSRKRARSEAGAPSGPRADAHFGAGFVRELLRSCEAAIVAGRGERFANTGAGWVLRYCLLEAPEETTALLERRAPRMTREGVKYALEKCRDAALKKRLMAAAAARPAAESE